MAPGSDWLTNFFLFTFFFGLLFTALSVLLGLSHVGGFHLGHGGHVHAGHIHIGGHGAEAGHGHADGHSGVDGESAGMEGPGLLNMPTIMAFLTWFGGAGYIFTRTFGFGAIITVPMAVLSGLFGGSIMFVLLARLLWPMMSKPLDRADYALPGTSARVVSPIRAGGVGEIVYTKDGVRFTAGARNVGELPVPRGTEVVILKYERGIAHVQPVDELLEVRGGEASRV